MGSPLKQICNVEPDQGASESLTPKSTAVPLPLQQPGPVTSPLRPPIYSKQPQDLHPAINIKYNQFPPRQVPDSNPPAALNVSAKPSNTQSSQSSGLQNNASRVEYSQFAPRHVPGFEPLLTHKTSSKPAKAQNFQKNELLNQTIKVEYNQFGPIQESGSKQPATHETSSKAANAQGLHNFHSLSTSELQKLAIQGRLSEVQPQPTLRSNLPPTASIQNQQQQAWNQGKGPNVLPASPFPQQQHRVLNQAPRSYNSRPLPASPLPQQRQRVPNQASRFNVPKVSPASSFSQHQRQVTNQAPTSNASTVLPTSFQQQQQLQRVVNQAPRSNAPANGFPASPSPKQRQRVQQRSPHRAPTSNVYPPSLPHQQRQAPNQPPPAFNPRLMLPPPVPQRQQNPVGHNVAIGPNTPFQFAQNVPSQFTPQQHGIMPHRSGKSQPSHMSMPSMTPPGTPVIQQQYGPAPQEYGQWQPSLPQQQYCGVQPNQALGSNTASPYDAQPQPYALQFQPHQLMGPNMSSPPVTTQQYSPQHQHYPSPPNQMTGSNMFPPPLPHQQQGFAQPQYGGQQQQYPQVPPKTTIKLNLPSSIVPQPQASPAPPTQVVTPRNPLNFTIDEVIQYLSRPFNTICFMSTDQAKTWVAPHKVVSAQTLEGLLQAEDTFQTCLVCPERFWGANGYLAVKYCAQCVVDMFEREWKLRIVLKWTQLYQQWASEVEKSSIELPKKAIPLLEIRVRLAWLRERQEFIRLETLRMSSELSLGHRMDRSGSCMCQGISVWQQLNRPLSGLIVHQDSDLGVTFGDPAAHEDIYGSEEESNGDERSLEYYGDIDIDRNGEVVESIYPDIWG